MKGSSEVVGFGLLPKNSVTSASALQMPAVCQQKVILQEKRT